MLSTDFVHGSPSWLDLGSPDIPATAAFYRAVFGWTFDVAGPETGGYGFLKLNGEIVGGVGEHTEKNATPGWTIYFTARDVDAVAKAVEQGGGQVRVEPSDIPGAGRMAQLTDPGGARFAAWQPEGGGGVEKINDSGSLYWAELQAQDVDSATAFYSPLFGWRVEVSDMPGMAYSILSTAEGDQTAAQFGGVGAAEGGQSPAWVPYFAVDSVDDTVTKVRENGGSVVMPTADVPEVGRLAWVTDQAGALFAVITPVRA